MKNDRSRWNSNISPESDSQIRSHKLRTIALLLLLDAWINIAWGTIIILISKIKLQSYCARTDVAVFRERSECITVGPIYCKYSLLTVAKGLNPPYKNDPPQRILQFLRPSYPSSRKRRLHPSGSTSAQRSQYRGSTHGLRKRETPCRV